MRLYCPMTWCMAVPAILFCFLKSIWYIKWCVWGWCSVCSYACAWVGLLLLLVLSVLFLPVLKPQMAPRRETTEETIQQLLASQTQLMQMMAQFMQNTTNNSNNNPPPPPPPPPPQVDRLARFLRLRPNKFSTANEPIIADDWLRRSEERRVGKECRL